MASRGCLDAWIGEVSDVGSESLKIAATTIALAVVLAAAFIFGGRMLLGSPVLPVAASDARDPPVNPQYRDRRVAIPPGETSPTPLGPSGLPSFRAEPQSEAAERRSSTADEPASGAAGDVAVPPSSPLTQLAPISAGPASAPRVPPAPAPGAQRAAGGDVSDVPGPAGTEVDPPGLAALGTGAGRSVTLPTPVQSASERRDATRGAPHAAPKTPRATDADEAKGVISRQRDALQRLFANKPGAAGPVRPGEPPNEVRPHGSDSAAPEAAATTGHRDRAKSSLKGKTLSRWGQGWPWRRSPAAKYAAEAEAARAAPAPDTAPPDVPQRDKPSVATEVTDGAGRTPEVGSAHKDAAPAPKRRKEKEQEKENENEKDAIRAERAPGAAKAKTAPDPPADKVTKGPATKASPAKGTKGSVGHQEAKAAAHPSKKSKGHKNAAAVGNDGAKDKAVTRPPRPPKPEKVNGRGTKAKRP